MTAVLLRLRLPACVCVCVCVHACVRTVGANCVCCARLSSSSSHHHRRRRCRRRRRGFRSQDAHALTRHTNDQSWALVATIFSMQVEVAIALCFFFGNYAVRKMHASIPVRWGIVVAAAAFVGVSGARQ